MNKSNKNFCVYEHLFPNGKRYIGITSKNPKARWENGNGHDTMPMEWYNKKLHYKDDDFSIIRPREDEKQWDIIIDKKHFYSQRDFANYIGENYTNVCLWLNQKNPMPLDIINHGLQVFVNDEEIIFTNVRERILGWEYKGKTFKNLRELSEYLNIKKGTLWYYIKNPHLKSSQKYLPLKDIHKIEF